jgi:hypothetical protein
MIRSDDALTKRIHNFLRRKDSQYPDLGHNLKDVPLTDINRAANQSSPYLP